MVRDALFVIGFVGMTWGFHLAWMPLGLIVPSVTVMVLTSLARPRTVRNRDAS